MKMKKSKVVEQRVKAILHLTTIDGSVGVQNVGSLLLDICIVNNDELG